MKNVKLDPAFYMLDTVYEQVSSQVRAKVWGEIYQPLLDTRRVSYSIFSIIKNYHKKFR